MADNRYIPRPYRPFAYPQDMGYPERHMPIDYSRNREPKTHKKLSRTYGINDMDFDTIYWFHHYIPPTPVELWDYNARLHQEYIKDYVPRCNAYVCPNANRPRLMPERR